MTTLWLCDYVHISLHYFHTYSSMNDLVTCLFVLLLLLILDAGVYICLILFLFCDLIHRLCDGTQFCLVWAYYKVYCLSLCTKPSNDMKGLLFSQEVHNVWTQTTLSHHFSRLLLILKPLCLAEKNS